MFYDHPLLGLYFLGDASDGSTSGQLAFASHWILCHRAGSPGNLNAIPIFQGNLISARSASGCAECCSGLRDNVRQSALQTRSDSIPFLSSSIQCFSTRTI